jgi:hypothetical protein
MMRCWTTTMTFPVLEQNLTYLLPFGNAFIKSITHDKKLKHVVYTAIELRTQFEVDLAMAVVEHKRP